eukprot:CAMPEP_0197516962 /NCGR_PEP_ID=MMETSP1318-20131121/1925_1 /TAXON_ID=552666 /ORGANISM="Partenskyella glossopodia, Strain RCC365" /LENGTH=544 /DNA_ID=CAMNT_0043066145 /DNA_START=28 /DNA_END=1662 /DNA_ORIENTATION=-
MAFPRTWRLSGVRMARNRLLIRKLSSDKPILNLRLNKATRAVESVDLPSLNTVNPIAAARHESILSTIGKTPVVKLQKMCTEEDVEVYVKCEYFNPMGSVKDRLALGAIEWAERHGQLKPGQTVVEASSGNTGIGLAMVCAAKGYPFVCVMSEAFSIERRKLMRFLGAKVVLTNPAHKGTGMVIKAKELSEKHSWFQPSQFETIANSWIHSETTGPEILEQFPEGLDALFLAYGTGGTVNGVGRVLRDSSPKTKIMLCEPDNAPMLYSGIQTTYEKDGTFKDVHPIWRPHLLQGWAPDWIPHLVDEATKLSLHDEIVHVSGDAAMDTSKDLAKKEGIFTGVSGGGTVAAALEYAKTAPKGSKILAMLADTGERYLSTPLFADIPADMTEEEKSIAESTESRAPPPVPLPEVTDEAKEFNSKLIAENKVVIFSLEYCEFCWTIFGLMEALGVEYRRVDIDSFQYAKDNMGNKYRSALSDMTGLNTFPQFFVDGKFIGGAVDACMMWKKGELKPLFEKSGIEVKDYEGDPFEFLPKWMTQNPLRSK